MDMITIRKGNVELSVPADQKDRYIKLGYSVYEGNKLVEEAPTTDVGVLYGIIETLKAENAELKSQLSKAKKTTSTKVKE